MKYGLLASAVSALFALIANQITGNLLWAGWFLWSLFWVAVWGIGTFLVWMEERGSGDTIIITHTTKGDTQ